MEARLRPVNAVLALVQGGDLQVPVLAGAGFRLAGLELPVGVGPECVVIDVLLLHEATGHLLAIESKSGANVEEGQARKYAALDAQQVVVAGAVTLPVRRPPSVEAVFVCNMEHSGRIRQGLERAGVSAAVLAVSADQVALITPDAAGSALSAAFASPAALPAGVPRIIAVDADSPVEAVRPQVHAVLVAHLARRSLQVSMAALAEEVAPHLSLYGRAARHRFQRRVVEVVRLIAVDEPGTFVYRPSTANHDASVQFLRTPEDNDPRGRTQAYQALARGPSRRRARPPIDPDQLDLLRELEEEDRDDTGPSVAQDVGAVPDDGRHDERNAGGVGLDGGAEVQ